MKTGLEICNGLALEIVGKKLASYAVPVNVAEKGAEAFDELTKEQRKEFQSYGLMAIKAIFITAAKTLTAPSPISKTGETGDFWPLDEWISTSEPAERVMYRHAVWVNIIAHRENQLLAVRRQNASFELGEQRRAKLKEAGMELDPKMTVEKAVKLLGETPEK